MNDGRNWILGACLLILSGCVHNPESKANDGVLDLRAWQPDQEPRVSLDGEWRFRSGLDRGAAGDELQTMPVPSFIDPGNHSAGVYSLDIELPENPGPLGLALPRIGTAYRLYVNDLLVSQVGEPAIRSQESVPQYRTRVVPLPGAVRLHLDLEFSNHEHRKGGIWNHIWIGPLNELQVWRDSRVAFEIFLVGALTIMGLYHLGLWLLRRNEGSPLYFAIVTLLIAVLTLANGQHLLTLFWPTIPWEMGVKLDFLSVILTPLFFGMYMRALYPEELHRSALRIVQAFALVLAIGVLLFTARYYTYWLPYIEIAIAGASLYFIYVIARSLLHGRDGALIFLLGLLALVLTVANDILDELGLIDSVPLVGAGLFAFLFSQSFLLSRRFAHAFKTSERLASELADSEKKYRRLVEGSNEIIFSLNHEGRFVTINRAVLERLGYRPAELQGRPLAEFLYDGEEGRSFLSRELFSQKLEELRTGNRAIEFRAEFRTRYDQSYELDVHLEKVELEDSQLILGRATSAPEDRLAGFCESDHQTYAINNNIVTADLLSRRITANLVGRLPADELTGVRFGVREMLVNAIEHGNLAISFEEKSAATEKGELPQLLLSRQRDARYRNRRVRVEHRIDDRMVEFVIADEGAGFDHAGMLARARETEADSHSDLLHGRGIRMTLRLFDEVEYNKTGNRVRLRKTLKMPAPR
ncbi:MAG: ATP-binding protein [Spirochaetales bacterium]|nr:ATP-binding protein [Leptospiraceae bacterium]MCP5483561.1 ATP-binding protein [Spirochaetales bacterium]MCP5486415.1 ATP-binding protein [Spirochaetales bacterium]